MDHPYEQTRLLQKWAIPTGLFDFPVDPGCAIRPVGTIHFVATTSAYREMNPVGMIHFVATTFANREMNPVGMIHFVARPTFRDLGVKQKQHPNRDEIAQVLA